MTTKPPADKLKFFLFFPTTSNFTMDETAYLSFTMPAGQSFPQDLSKIMNKTERFLSFEESDIRGVETQSCEGANCVCTGCRENNVVCVGEDCKGVKATTDGMSCSESTCTLTSNMYYTMFPMYPDILSIYKPTFKFIRYISASSGGTTPPPLMTEGVIFSVSLPSDAFKTSDAFKMLQDVVLAYAPPNQGYVKHNTAVLQKLLKSESKMDRKMLKTASAETTTKGKTFPPQVSRPKTTMPPGTTKSARPPQTPKPKKSIIERYEEEDVVMNDVVVPETEQDDPDPIPALLEPEPDSTFLKTEAPYPMDLVFKFLIIPFSILLAIFIIYMIYAYMTKPKQKTQTKRGGKRRSY
jgi:hypothetical protein